MPARVRAPRDKSHAEKGVGICEAWALAPLAGEVFHSLAELNDAVRERVAWINARPFQQREGSRDSVFEEAERPALNPLPEREYTWYDWRVCKVAPDFHVQCDYMRYSVPHELVGKWVDVRLDAMRVAVVHEGTVVAEHDRLYGAKGQYSTREEHMPEAQREAESPWSRAYFERRADAVGPATRRLIDAVIDSRPVEPQAYVPCKNILSLARGGRRGDLEAACARLADAGGAVSYTRVKHLMAAIKAERDAGRPAQAAQAAPFDDRARHAGRTRGSEHYRRDGGDRHAD